MAVPTAVHPGVAVHKAQNPAATTQRGRDENRPAVTMHRRSYHTPCRSHSQTSSPGIDPRAAGICFRSTAETVSRAGDDGHPTREAPKQRPLHESEVGVCVSGTRRRSVGRRLGISLPSVPARYRASRVPSSARTRPRWPRRLRTSRTLPPSRRKSARWGRSS